MHASSSHQSPTTTDLAVYGTYAPHLRYRQERIQQDAVIANLSHIHRAPSRFDVLRERVGMTLIAWGTRLEGRCQPGSPAPAR